MTKDIQQENEAKAIALFEADGASSAVVAKQLDIGRATASRYRKKWLDDKKNKAVEAVSNLDPLTVLALAEQLEGTSPSLSRNLAHLSESISTLNKLEPIVHEAIADLIVTVQSRMQDPDIKVGELNILGNLLLKSFATLYNRPSVEVNVSQTNTKVVQNAVTDRLNGLLHGVFPDTIEGEVD